MTETGDFKVSSHRRAAALATLGVLDSGYPVPEVVDLLRDPLNERLLDYVYEEAFTHVFPGDDIAYPTERFLADFNRELARGEPLHLWTIIPLCRYRCHFCQFPIMVLPTGESRQVAKATEWVDANLAEAALWLEAVPELGRVPVGQFCLFGGTPTAVPMPEIERLLSFYRQNFNFTGETLLQAEGSPDSLTREVIGGLAALGFHELTYGMQTFDDRLLGIAHRRHTGADARRVVRQARELGFERIDGDLLYGIPGQTVDGFLADIRTMIELDFDTVVAIKLHLRSFHEVNTAVGHESPAAWENPAVRREVAEQGFRWPSLGEQFQMREQFDRLLAASGYVEYPATYFPKRSVGPEYWRSLNLDQDRQFPQLGIGLGAYAWSNLSEANTHHAPRDYLAALAAGRLPLRSATRISAPEREVRAVRMALSTCQPLRDELHRSRFAGASLFDEHWGSIFGGLADRGLVTVDATAATVTLTDPGRTLVEAIMATDIV
ncbi:radical SAM protein [Nocardia sp. NPDC059240]|uniref:radical SAM protein n=1 Tax=Nocardia sp. NPDC059240 TaxID=3346786 RepID=UPI0036A5C557